MIPIIYEPTETAFGGTGVGRLPDMISCSVVEERNGIFECDFEYPVNGRNFGLIRPGRIIGVFHDTTGDIQPFDIMSYSKPISGVVSFHAVHVSYRQNGLVTVGSNITNLPDAMLMLANGRPDNPFTYINDFTVNAILPAADGIPKSVRDVLGGTEGSILDTYGGELKFDRFTVSLLRNRGKLRNLIIRYGVNMSDYLDDTDYSGVHTAVVPYWSGGDNAVVIGDVVSLGPAAYAGRDICVPLDVSSEFEQQPTKAQVEAVGREKLISSEAMLPAQNIQVKFTRLQDFAGYEYLKDLYECDLCDTVRVIFPEYGMTGSYKIVKVVYDVLLERYTEMELGSLSVTLKEALGIK